MGLHTSYEAMALRWAELCSDPLLRDLPGKVELNAYGTIELSPASNLHAWRQGDVATQLGRQLPHGRVLGECSIATSAGVRCPDVAWASPEFVARHGHATPFPEAPEICVEVLSPSNTKAEMEMKTGAYFEAGAVEVWIVGSDGSVTVRDAGGILPASRFGVVLVLA